MAEGLKYSKISGVVRWSQGFITLRRGQSIDANHDLAKERPDLFDDVEPGPEIGSRVQSTMQRPGEARTEKPQIIKAPPRGSAQ